MGRTGLVEFFDVANIGLTARSALGRTLLGACGVSGLGR